MNLTASFFSRNRKKLLDQMPNNTMLVLFSNELFPCNGDQYFALRQHSDLYYLTGITQEKSALILIKNQDGSTEEILSVIKPDLKTEIWEGKKLTPQESTAISGIANVIWESDLEQALYDYAENSETLYLLGSDAYASGYTQHIHNHWKMQLSERYPQKNILSPRKMIDTLRLIKSEEEIAVMQKAVDITNEAFNRILSVIKPGMMEYEIEAEMSYVFRKNGANGHAYQPIVGSGINACGLHYIKNNAILKEGDLLLMDFGADWQYYAADLSRTIPVNGRFTDRQKQIYNLVLEVQKKSIELYVPGNTINIINKKTKAWMEEALLREDIEGKVSDLFPHGTTHFLGIDVHDVGAKDVVFEEGMVLTCEPGLYLPKEAIGVRIENDIVVAKKPIDLMQNVIREVEAIEEAMRN